MLLGRSDAAKDAEILVSPARGSGTTRPIRGLRGLRRRSRHDRINCGPDGSLPGLFPVMVSGGEVGLAGEVVVGGLVGAGGGAQPGGRGRAGVGELGQAGAEQVVVGVGEQQRVVQAGVGDLVAAGVRDAGDEAVFAEAAQVVGHLPGGDVLGALAEEGRDEGAQLAVGEAAGQQPVDEQGLQQRVDAGVAEPQPGDAGAGGGDDGRGQGGEGLGAADGVVADGLDAEQAPVGGKADLPQSGQVGQPFGDAEVGGASLMVVSVRIALPSLWYCLIFECL